MFFESLLVQDRGRLLVFGLLLGHHFLNLKGSLTSLRLVHAKEYRCVLLKDTAL